MWDTKTTNKTKQKQAYRGSQQIDIYQRGSDAEGGKVKWVKGINCMMMDRNQTFGGECIIEYTDIQ